MTRKEYLDAIHTIAGHFCIGDLLNHAGVAFDGMENAIMRMANSHSDKDIIDSMKRLAELDITMALIADKFGIDAEKYMRLVEKILDNLMKPIKEEQT